MGYKLCRGYFVGSKATGATGYQQLIGLGQSAAVGLKIIPDPLIVRPRLRHDVGHVKDGIVVLAGVRPILGRTKVTPVEIDGPHPIVISGRHPVKPCRQVGVGEISAGAGDGPTSLAVKSQLAQTGSPKRSL